MEAPHYPWTILRSWLFVCCLLVLGTISTYATHLRAGNIIVRKVTNDCSNLTYRITIRVYTNTNNTDVLFGGDQDYLDFGDKTPRILVPEQDNIMIDTDRGIAYAEYSINHTFAGNQKYTISYVEPNRNRYVLNMDNSGETTFYLETVIRIDPYLGCSTPAVLDVDPIDFACVGVAWTHHPGAYDPDGDSISYEMTIPNKDVGQTVVNYQAPNDPRFYPVYEQGQEDGSGTPEFSIDPVEGTITWNSPGANGVGEYNIAFNIIEWRLKDGVYYKMGYVRRDMQIIVEDCENNRPELEVPPDTCIVAGTTLNATIYGFDLYPDPPAPQVLDNVKLEAFSEVFESPPTVPAVATVTPEGVFQPSVPKAELDFKWVTNCNHVRRQPYQVVFKVSDTRGLVTFKTWFIKVVAPEPTWESAVLDPGLRQDTLTWDPYFCSNASRMQIWRRVDSVSFQYDNCQTGMPDYLGYEKIDEVPINGTNGLNQYIDNNDGKGLAPGAMYCYRLVAIFPQPRGGESYVSKDICVGPILADVPIITHVTVDKTDQAAGEIRVSWRKPFEADPDDFPPPYHYKINRINDANVVDVNDTTYLDTNINTEENIYYYSVSAFASNNAFVGTSDTASAVRLNAKSQVGQIELKWSAIVPWSNFIQSTPTENYMHVIYRGPEGASEADMVRIDSVDANAGGLIYIDSGQYNNEDLEDNKTYCYVVKTRGGYGNPKIDEPLENYSQMLCAQTGDEFPPTCTLEVSVELLDCASYYESVGTCTAPTGVTNTLFWSRPTDPVCRADIKSYNIYRSNVAGGKDFMLIATNVIDTVYEDKGLPSFAWCYKISPVDASGNEGNLSAEVCNDNCPYYELPNVFTPNGDDFNDVFSAYSNRYCTEATECTNKCARFVKKVKFRVYNRWGQEVYTYQSGGEGSEKTIYIDWNGKDNKGSELTPAVYFYVAEVTFDVLRPSDRTRIYKGWVHLFDDPE
jgi:hypothetical protein